MAEVLGLLLCAIGLAVGAFQVATWFGLFVAGAAVVAGVQVFEWSTLSSPAVDFDERPSGGDA